MDEKIEKYGEAKVPNPASIEEIMEKLRKVLFKAFRFKENGYTVIFTEYNLKKCEKEKAGTFRILADKIENSGFDWIDCVPGAAMEELRNCSRIPWPIPLNEMQNLSLDIWPSANNLICKCPVSITLL